MLWWFHDPLLTLQDGQSHSLVSNERVLILMPKPLFSLASRDMTKEYACGEQGDVQIPLSNTPHFR